MTPASRVPVLMFHDVVERRYAGSSRYVVTRERFAAQMDALAARGRRAVPLDALLAWLEGGAALQEGDFVLTFDDGYKGVRDHALPVLERLHWPFAVFLVTDRLGGHDDWPRLGGDPAPAAPVALLDGADLLDMRGRGCSFHSHTRTHRSLRSLDDDALARELAGSRAALVGLLGESTYCLAYPYGHVDDRVAAAARAAGYRAALSVHSGFNRRDVDPFRIRRIDVFGTDGPRALVRKVDLGTNDGSWRASLRYRWRQLTDRRPRGAA